MIFDIYKNIEILNIRYKCNYIYYCNIKIISVETDYLDVETLTILSSLKYLFCIIDQ